MKVFLCKGKRLSFIFPKNVTWERQDVAVWQRKRKSEINLVITKNDVASIFDAASNVTQIDWRKQFANVWTSNKPNNTPDLINQRPGDRACLKVTLDHLPGGTHPLIKHDQLSFKVKGKLLQDIRIALGVQNVRLQMELFDARVQSTRKVMQLPTLLKNFEPMVKVVHEMVQHFNQEMSGSLDTLPNPLDTNWINCRMDMPLKSVPDDLKLAYGAEQIALPNGWKQYWLKFRENDNVEFSLKTNLLISVEEPEINANKKFYMGGTFEDAVEIIASNEKMISCIGRLLKAQSGLLKIIIEENGNKLFMTDISELGVKAFVAYVYCKDLSVPLQVFSIAVELFQIAQKYSISKMELEMKNVLLGKPYLWFDDINAALRLLLFVARIPAHSDLKFKILRVVKSMPVDAVVKSQIYQQLFQENQLSNKLEDAKQLCDALLSLPMVDIMSLSKL